MTANRNARAERYGGTVTPVGNSKGIRLDAEFFKAHPEFNGKVDATVIADGQVLLSTKTSKQRQADDDEIDPVMLGFLCFLQKQMVEHPAKARLLASIYKAITQRVPADPDHPDFRLGKTLGPQYTNWRRVKKGMPDWYQLFFRFASKPIKLIVYVWFNDEDTLRKAGSKTHVYEVFNRMLSRGEVPASINDLMAECNVPADEQFDHLGVEHPLPVYGVSSHRLGHSRLLSSPPSCRRPRMHWSLQKCPWENTLEFNRLCRR